jgi:xylulokinase
MHKARYIVGIDLGTTNLKGVLCDVEGGVLAQASFGYPMHRPQSDYAEQNALDWIDAFWRVIDQLIEGRSYTDIEAIGICSQVNTHVFVDEAGRPLRPAIVWQDSRVAPWATAIDEHIDPRDRVGWWSSNMSVGPSHTLPRIAWMQEVQPEIWARTARVVSPKDFLLYHLTGCWTTDPLSCFDLVDDHGNYISALIERVPGAMGRLPPLSPYSAVVGRASHPRLHGAAPQVINGTMDAFGCLFGSGARGAGDGAYISGTSEIIALIADKPGQAPGIVSFIPVDGWHVQAGPTQSGGDTLRWLSTLFGQSYETILQMAANVDRSAADAIFLPHLQGERAPFWDSQARGTFVGLDAADGGGEMVLAALEGVAFSARLIFERAEDAAGRIYDHLFIGGSGNRSDFWAQVRADVFGLPLKRVKCLDTGCIGAAMMAGVGTGTFASIEQASQAFVEIERIFYPNPELKAHYDKKIRRFVRAYEALKPIYSS